MSAVALRPATLADLEVLRGWDEAEHVREAGGDPEANAMDWAMELTREVSWRQILIAEEAGRPIGAVQIIDPAEEETHYWGDCGPGLRAIDIWIGEADALGRGLGTAMMRQTLERCFAAPEVGAVLIDPLAANTAAHRFYERLGFRLLERRTFLGVDECVVYRLTRYDWERTSRA